MMALPILHTASDQSPPESSFLLLITSTASFCEKSSVSSRKQEYMDPLWLNVAVWKMQIWSPERTERVMWSHFLALADFLGTNTLLNRRGQGDKLSTDSLNTRQCWVCSPAIPKAWHSSVSTSEEGALLKGSKDSPAPVLLLLTWPVTAHSPEDTDPTNAQLPSHFTHAQIHAS